jgi:uncharacterized protein YjiS (DUF1127 family)
MQFAVASVVDANTQDGLLNHLGATKSRHEMAPGKVDRFPRLKFLGQSITNFVANLLAAYRERSKARRDLEQLQGLSDHLLRDIGIGRNDLDAVDRGAISLEDLRNRRSQSRTESLATLDQFQLSRCVDDSVNVANEASYKPTQCA